MVGLERSSLPTVYLTEPIDVGVAVNTDGSIDSVGHKFEAYDVVNYIVLGTAVTELDRAQYYIHPNTTANKIYLAEYIDGDAITSLTPGTPVKFIHSLLVLTTV
ncbi:MAG: hypothetical protein CM15mV13_3150 [uncultured marine virus]|nr:MAG: hypothetical protein CM15mV13_3150 [uncultured marine virus]